MKKKLFEAFATVAMLQNL